MNKVESIIKALSVYLVPLGFSLEPHGDKVQIKHTTNGGCEVFDIEECMFLYEGLRPKKVTID